MSRKSLKEKYIVLKWQKSLLEREIENTAALLAASKEPKRMSGRKKQQRTSSPLRTASDGAINYIPSKFFRLDEEEF